MHIDTICWQPNKVKTDIAELIVSSIIIIRGILQQPEKNSKKSPQLANSPEVLPTENHSQMPEKI